MSSFLKEISTEISANQKIGVSEPVKEMADSQTPEKDAQGNSAYSILRRPDGLMVNKLAIDCLSPMILGSV